MQSLFFFIVALALLIVVHEYGHFWVARRCGVKVLRFSIGFGKPLWRRLGRDGTEFVIAPIPLGGYVKMLDERDDDVDEADRDRAFNRQSLAKRTAIVVAGPAANLLFAIAAYWLIFMMGIPGLRPYIDTVMPESAAEQAGLQAGDEIVAVNDRDTPTWSAVLQALAPVTQKGGDVEIAVQVSGTTHKQVLSLPRLGMEEISGLLDRVGIVPLRPDIEPVLGQIVPGGPADQAGLRSGDRLLSAEGEPLGSWAVWVDRIRNNPGSIMAIEIERGGERMLLSLRPETGEDGAGRIGAGVDTSHSEIPAEMLGVLQYGALGAVSAAIIQTWEFSLSTLSGLWGMLVGTVSIENLGGPISIAQIAGSSAEQGLITFVTFLAMISITLGVLNLLPIPVLDGGHLLLFFIEWIRGKPLSESTQLQWHKVGLMLVVLLMLLAFFNDLSRQFG